jgi:hypothetical protein
MFIVEPERDTYKPFHLRFVFSIDFFNFDHFDISSVLRFALLSQLSFSQAQDAVSYAGCILAMGDHYQIFPRLAGQSI